MSVGRVCLWGGCVCYTKQGPKSTIVKIITTMKGYIIGCVRNPSSVDT